MHCFFFPGFHVFFHFGELFLVVLIVVVLIKLVAEPRDRFMYSAPPGGRDRSVLHALWRGISRIGRILRPLRREAHLNAARLHAREHRPFPGAKHPAFGSPALSRLARISHQGLPPAGRDRMGPVLRVSGGLVALCRGVGRVCGVRKWNSVLRIRFSEDRKTHFPYFVCFQLRFCRFLSFIRFWLSGAEPHFRGC